MIRLDPPLRPRNGRVLRVMGIARISTVNQDIRSLDDQKALLCKWVQDRYDGPVEWKFIEGQGSGESLVRDQVAEAEELVGSGQFDLVVMEDLSRHMRRMHAVIFCETCEDKDTRLVAINDGIDTFNDWRLHAFFAAMKHEQSNRDTSQRIRRSLRNRFMQGGVVQYAIYGYIKPAGCQNDADMSKDPDAEPIYDEWFRMLENGAGYSEVADWLNERGIAPGPYCRLPKWDCRMVARTTHNPILKGLRVRNRKMSRRVNRTGRHRCVDAPPEDLLERDCPHLAFIEPDRYDRVLRLLKKRNSKYRRHHQNGRDPRKNVPKKRTRWPGQHIYCGICGRLYVFGGHGQKEHLMCTGAREYKCWNAITVDGPLAVAKLSDAILERITNLPDFDAEFLTLIQEELQQCDKHRQQQLRDIAHRLERVDREIANILQAVRASGGSPTLLQELTHLERTKEHLLIERDEAEKIPKECWDVPPMEDIKKLALDTFQGLASESPEFGRQMQRLIPRIVVHPYRLINGGHITLRAEFVLDLSACVEEIEQIPGGVGALQTNLVVDLFDPPQREAFRKRVQQLRAEGLTERKVAEQLGITVTAAQRAAALNRLMLKHGMSDPYVRLTEPPEDYKKLRRHKHTRYSFEPLDDADQL